MMTTRLQDLAEVLLLLFNLAIILPLLLIRLVYLCTIAPIIHIARTTNRK